MTAPGPQPARTASDGSRRADVLGGLALFFAAAVSLALLVFVARTEAERIHTHQVHARVAAQLQTLVPDLQRFLTAGLPLEQYGGFARAARRLVESDPAVGGVALHDRAGNPMAKAGEPRARLAPRVTGQAAAADQRLGAAVQLRRTDAASTDRGWQIAIPLEGRFADQGHVAATVRTDAVVGVVRQMTVHGLALAAGLAAAFAVAGVLLARWRGWLLSGVFVTFAVAVVVSLGYLYAKDVRARAAATAESVAARLGPIADYDLRLSDVRGLDTLLRDYATADPSLGHLAVTDDERVRITPTRSFDPGEGPRWQPPASSHALTVPVGGRDDGLAVRAAVPNSAIYRQVVTHLEDFATVLTACAFVAVSLFGLARATGGAARDGPGSPGRTALRRAQPVLFLAVTAEHLSYSFLPPLLARTASSAMGEAATPLLMAAYFAGFAGALVPGGHAAARQDPRRIAVLGAILAGLGLLAMLAAPSFWPVLGGRVGAGVGQGLMLAAFQVYLMDAAGPANKTYAASVVVFAFNAGMIAGTALGGLAVRAIGPDGIFVVAAVLAGLAALSAPALPPSLRARKPRGTGAGADDRPGWRATVRVAVSSDVLRALLLIGWPAKAALTGVVVFALPLLLDGRALPPERIGQAMVLYALAVLAVSKAIAGAVDRAGRTRPVLSGGALLAAAGIGVLALIAGDAPRSTTEMLAITSTGILLLGIGHGCVNAPIVAYVAGSRAAERHGHAVTTSTYRLLERVGHVIGPVLVGGALRAGGATGLAALAGGTALAAVVFAVLAHARRERVEVPA